MIGTFVKIKANHDQCQHWKVLDKIRSRSADGYGDIITAYLCCNINGDIKEIFPDKILGFGLPFEITIV